MEKQKIRDEIDNKYKWDLTRIYKSDKDFYKDLDIFKDKIKDIKKFENNLFTSKDNLLKYINLDEELDKLSNKLSEYASLKNAEDSTNTKYQEMINKLYDVYSKYQENISFFNEEFYKTDYNKLLKLLDSDDKLKTYKLTFERLNRYKDHYLDKDKEIIVNKLTKNYDSSSNIYDMLVDSEIKYGIIKDEDDKDVELTQSNYSRYITSLDRRVRMDSFNLMYKTFESFKNTISLTYLNSVDNDIAISNVYNYKSCLSRKLYNDNIDISLYDNLIESVHSKLNYLYDYFDYKKKYLN